ncbi:aminoglycoside 6-adenylyltransferase [Virgibacillus dakarensis]|uniref:aminoglycoside 6-adenylyltransferase n=1 Tax=Virgibacillus dakarensis TaxID=1917889 RepID=UPI0022862F16|nr:aminoglycoside 6-adenylyltransferase [Virgibacillus dakarensis]
MNRNVLIRMIEWNIGIKTDFLRSAGKHGKYFEDFFEKDEWREFIETYTNADYECIWDSLFIMSDLFRKVALLPIILDLYIRMMMTKMLLLILNVLKNCH